MTIKQGLKKKNRLINQVDTAFMKTNLYNSYLVENFDKRPYSSKQSLEEYIELTNQLIDLKSKIQRANAPVYDKIFRLSELKSMVKKLKGLDCSEGVKKNSWNSDEEKTVAEITVRERDELILSMENEIDSLQDELDEWNQITLLPS